MAHGVTPEPPAGSELQELREAVTKLCAENGRLRARDEAAKAVVRAFAALRANEALMQAVLLPPWLIEELDALARAHEDGGTGR